MADYIEREALIKDFQTNGSVFVYGVSTINAIVSRINRQPAADVVEVVRCKDCKHCEILNEPNMYAICHKTELKFYPFELDTRTHYCSLGERKDNGKKDFTREV